MKKTPILWKVKYFAYNLRYAVIEEKKLSVTHTLSQAFKKLLFLFHVFTCMNCMTRA